jgi:hypothetical protein
MRPQNSSNGEAAMSFRLDYQHCHMTHGTVGIVKMYWEKTCILGDKGERYLTARNEIYLPFVPMYVSLSGSV